MATKRITNKLPQFTATMQARAARGMTQALILGASEAAAFTPQQTSNLINSQFKHVDQSGAKIVGTAGYTAEYALAVHEASGKLKGLPRPKKDGKAQGNFWDPRGQPEFLKKGFERAEPNIRAVLKGSIKTK